MSSLRELRKRHPELVDRALAAAQREGLLWRRQTWSVIWQQLMETAQGSGIKGHWGLATKYADAAALIAFVCGGSVEAHKEHHFSSGCRDFARGQARAKATREDA